MYPIGIYALFDKCDEKYYILKHINLPKFTYFGQFYENA